jgi:hypothetical protein
LELASFRKKHTADLCTFTQLLGVSTQDATDYWADFGPLLPVIPNLGLAAQQYQVIRVIASLPKIPISTNRYSPTRLRA